MEIKINSKNLGELVIKLISKEKAKELIVNNHYSKKWNNPSFGLYSFGIFEAGKEEENDCLGVASYGYMKNLKAKIFYHPNPEAWMIELNRMWISDKLGKNAESILIAHSLKMLKRLNKNIVAVQSFADGRLGCGTIYKASNFKYFGKHQTIFLKNKLTGEITHQQNLTNSTSKTRFIRDNIAYLLGDFETFKVDTYRYIFPLCKRFQFKSPQQPYPAYNKGQHEYIWIRNKKLIKDRLINFINDIKE
ncbi:Mom family adenine methylcarbamoylation protein [Chryseobacterium daeguense]|uniref:Mom family adenine methylcarbamoylation protein n=1 Tax=Chryseobacterium daeguense TaxID=412438 RepID=UPI0003FEDD72|nr:hypothetical protein [Chryseobacterium daeguense]